MENKKSKIKGILISLFVLMIFKCVFLLALPSYFLGINTIGFHKRYDAILSDILLFSSPVLFVLLVAVCTTLLCYFISFIIVCAKTLYIIISDIINKKFK